MLSVLLASVLVQKSAPEPRLEWSTFGDFAAKQFEGSEYRLVMDREIGDRPMVYYFSHLGTDKLALFKRSCKELCLNADFDEKLKKVIVSGPTSDAGMTLRTRVQLGIQKAQEIARQNWGKTLDQINAEADLLIQSAIKEESAKQKAELQFKRSVLISLMRPESRAVMACLLSSDPATLATRVTTKFSGEGAIDVSRDALKILDSGFTDRSPSDPAEASYWQDMKKTYDEMVADNAVPVMTHSVAKHGAVSFMLRLDGKTKSKHIGSVAISDLSWLDLMEDNTKDIVPETLALEEIEPKQSIFWGVDGMNAFQTLAIKHKWNTVAWLDTGRNHKEYTSTLKGFSSLKKVRVKLTDDGWMVPYILGQRWPMYSGNWRGVIKMDGKIEPETDLKLLREYLESLSFEEIVGMAEIKGEMIDYRLDSLISSARLIRAALRISESTKLKEFDLKVSQLDLNLGAEISHYWPYVVNEQLKWPPLVQKRGLARIGMSNRDLADPDYDDIPTSRTLIISLAVPTGALQVGKEVYVFEQCSVVLKKEK